MMRRIWAGGRRRIGIALAAAAVMAAVAAPRPAHTAGWGKEYFGDIKVVTQHGKTLQFYDDLIKDKIVVISFIFTTCREFCPLTAARLSELQAKLGPAMGRDYFFYSISVDPEVDTPERLKAYADTFGAGPGWLFLTGKPDDIHALRYKLGDRGTKLGEHRNDVILGNGATGEWAKNTVLGDLNVLAYAVRSMDANWAPKVRAARRTDAVIVDLEARPGEALFTRLCAGCHSVGRGSKVGPDLAGVTQRRDRDWLLRFIANPEKMRREKDPVAAQLAAAFPTVRMPGMGVPEKDAADLLAYIAYREERERLRSHPLQALAGLTTHKGERLAPEAFKGTPVAVFFGFTHCPDVCPTTLMDWSNVLAGLGKDADRLKVLFVSVDSDRDTPAVLADYMGSFDPRITALTGSKADIVRAARAFDAHFEKVPGTGDSYSFDHTTKVYLLGPDGSRAAAADLRTPEAERQQMLAALLARR